MNYKLIQITSSLLLMCLCEVYSNDKNNNNGTRITKSNRLLFEPEKNEMGEEEVCEENVSSCDDQESINDDQESIYDDQPIYENQPNNEPVVKMYVSKDPVFEEIKVSTTPKLKMGRLGIPPPSERRQIIEMPFRSPTPPPVNLDYETKVTQPHVFKRTSKMLYSSHCSYPNSKEVKSEIIDWDNFMSVIDHVVSTDPKLENYLKNKVYPKRRKYPCNMY
ncbi:Plasmodium exported protein, unknown function [Plasmodium berghei]|uniref:Erythrocyte membrane associated protein 2 n=2 Tax=Plasmodium berghei TaxID=5821 RepID=A0A509ATC3_PLABA|nr:Plasmodium exported protein, unknown function [Plasmodium berghei ANKA]CXI70181.1 Plasmodium exported protein, unknown function [Plasmodium berghei]SBW38124.1 Plasmodium exported protein, unknown function [Plasmodium berghei]SCL81540.1 Plasmodium exported protein, unknown function [Plasmodium berghei]SCL81786.1 Plasmodium exported protein, unknown function [Plasmodium berghei]SCL85696.1 Plasmodium exported protein, unknown function [Plasmodium berghei]|eukprot:XP_034422667.1 Plasmodium exported protein, unknown function [Plasmodium berghei ANKA]